MTPPNAQPIEMLLDEAHIPELFGVLDALIKEGVGIFLLQGDLASGKTTLVQRYIASKDPALQATSPTFSLMQQYGTFYHYDLYHHSLEKFLSLGLLESLAESGVHFIEWGEDLAGILRNSGYNYRTISISKQDSKRSYRIS